MNVRIPGTCVSETDESCLTDLNEYVFPIGLTFGFQTHGHLLQDLVSVFQAALLNVTHP